MPAYWFRFLKDDVPSGYFGLVVAENEDQLCWELDQYGDPGQVEIKRATMGSVCFLLETDGDTDSLGDPQDIELSECFYGVFDGTKGWRRLDGDKRVERISNPGQAPSVPRPPLIEALADSLRVAPTKDDSPTPPLPQEREAPRGPKG